MIYLDCIVLFDDSAIIKILVNLVFSESMLNVALFNLLTPTVIKMMNLARNLATVLKVITFVNLRVPAFSKKT